jgi:hypothetical protein
MDFGTVLREKIEQTYPDFLNRFPRYSKALNLMEMLMNESRKQEVMFSDDYDLDIKWAITHDPLPVIEIIPKKEPTLLAWNGDYYFDRYYVWKPITNRKVVTALELLGDASALIKMFFSVRLHKLLYESVGYYKLSFLEALKIKQTFPINQLMNRVRNYMQIPMIKFDNDDPIKEEIQLTLNRVRNDPNDEDVEKYSKQVDEFETRSGIKLTTNEKIEFIAEKIADQLIANDYDEIES